MKKFFALIVLILVIAVGAGVYWVFSNLNGIVQAQVEKHGSRLLQTEVRLTSVDLQLLKGFGDLKGFSIHNPKNYSDNPAFAFDEIKLDIDIKSVRNQPLIVDEVLVAGPSVLFEMNSEGKNNLTVLKDNLTSQLSAETKATEQETADPAQDASSEDSLLVIVNKVTVQGVKLTLDLSAMGQEKYEITLPAFNAEPVGMPDGLPAEQVGGAIVKSMISNITKQATKAAEQKMKERAAEELKKRASEEGGSLLDKLKGN